MKTLTGITGSHHRHWVGDGFPVRTLFDYSQAATFSPFLLLDYAGPLAFAPTTARRGVGQHPHRGFETVTIVYDGAVEHRDSTGAGGIIGPGDVQWMTAAGGILHEEFHAPAFAAKGGTFCVVQLWVNLPARDKMSAPGYQSLRAADIPAVALPDGAGAVRVIAGALAGARGPARTFTPVNVWDGQLTGRAAAELTVPDGHNAFVVVLDGRVRVNDSRVLGEADVAVFDRTGTGLRILPEGEAHVLVLSGAPIDEPVFGHGPFVMNTRAEIIAAVEDFNGGRFGTIRPAGA
ncbi:pirin family protein [Pseudoxanthobacter sp.]|uniref:pirin family protein n=1 Tax=Pseudoxanthobacter sp. TaxID=1925742 RepID=UPI002FE3D917